MYDTFKEKHEHTTEYSSEQHVRVPGNKANDCTLKIIVLIFDIPWMFYV